MDTKRIGNIGEAKALCKLVELGIPVYIPFGDNEKADLIADFGGKLNKIQVKTSVEAKNGKIVFSLVSSTLHRKKGTNHKYTQDEIDYYICYNIQRDKLFLVPAQKTPISSIAIRYDKTKNNQTKDINWEEDLLLEKQILNILG